MSNEITIELYKPLLHQKSVHDAITYHLENVPRGTDEHQKIFTICSPRQVGKSALCTNELIRFGMMYNGGTSVYITPSLKLAKKVYRELLKAGKQLIKNHNGTDLIITFINDSEIYFASAEQGDNIRGLTVKKGVLIIDEAAFINTEFYLNVVSPFVDFHKEISIIVSTPLFKQGFFYDEYINGLKSGYSFNFSEFDLSAIRSKSKLEELRLKTPAQVFKREYLGIFVDGEGSVFGDFSKCIINNIPEYTELYLGIDFGTGFGKDYTVITGINEHAEQVFQERFNDIPPTLQVERIAGIYNQYKQFVKRVYAEQNSIGKVYIDMLKKYIPNIESFNTDPESKRKLVENLQIAFQNASIKILGLNSQINQLSAYESKVNPKTNYVSYNAPSGFNDDDVMALMLAYECYKKSKEGGNYIVTFGKSNNTKTRKRSYAYERY